MRSLLPAALSVCAGLSLPAQSPLTTTFAGGVSLVNSPSYEAYFDLTVNTTLTITQIDTHYNVTGPAGTLEVWTCSGTYLPNVNNLAAWTLQGSAPITPQGPGVPTPATGLAVVLPAGNYGVCLSHVTPGSSIRYTSGANVYSTAEMTLSTGSTGNTGVGNGVCCTPRTWNGSIYYTTGTGFASCQTYGASCPDLARSFYEIFSAAGSIDLSGTAGAENVVQMIFTGSNYVVTPGSSAWFMPGTGTNSMALLLADDSNSPPINLPFTFNYPGGSANTIQVGSNGYVYIGSGSATRAFYSSVATVLNDGPRHSPFYGDPDPSAGGTITYDEDPAGGIVYVTWDAVPEWNTMGQTTSTFQIALDAGGRVEYRYRDCQIAAAPAFVGFSPGAGARDPGPIDISASLPFQTAGQDFGPIGLNCNGRPVIGGPSFSLDLVDPNNNALAILFLGLARTPAPGINLSGAFGGMESCFQHVAFPLVTVGVAVPMAGAASFSLTIPPNPSLSGLSLFGQIGAASVPPVGTTSGFSATNGVQLTLDNM